MIYILKILEAPLISCSAGDVVGRVDMAVGGKENKQQAVVAATA